MENASTGSEETDTGHHRHNGAYCRLQRYEVTS